MKGVSKQLDGNTENLLNNDQKEALKSLKEGVEKIKFWKLVRKIYMCYFKYINNILSL